MSETSFFVRDVICERCTQPIKCDKGYGETLRIDAHPNGKVVISPPESATLVVEMEDAFTIDTKFATGRFVLICLKCAENPTQRTVSDDCI